MSKSGEEVAQEIGCLLGCAAVINVVLKQGPEVKRKERED